MSGLSQLTPLKQEQITLHQSNRSSIQGLFIALMIIGLWIIGFALWFSLAHYHFHVWWVLPAIAIQTFLYTGLFITAHDAMHRSLCPHNLRLNDALGLVD